MYREWRKIARSGLARLQESWEAKYQNTRLFRIHEHWSIPGFLQTADYANECNAWWIRILNLSGDSEAATAKRLSFQRMLREGQHRFVILLAEQVLYARIGTKEQFGRQLDRLVEATNFPKVSLGIIPAVAGMGAHTQTAFWILDETMVKVETLTAALDITSAEEIRTYVDVFNEMRRSAVFGEHAKALVAKARNRLLQ